MSRQRKSNDRSAPKNHRNQHRRLAQAKKVAAGTTAAAALYLGAQAPPADAAVIYNNSSFFVGNGDPPVEWDIDGLGGPEFQIRRQTSSTPRFTTSTYSYHNSTSSSYPTTNYNFVGSTYYRSGFINSQGRNGRGLVRQSFGGFHQFRNLPYGLQIGPTLSSGYVFGSSSLDRRASFATTTAISSTFYGFDAAAGFSAGSSGYIGFKFEGGSTHYGWAQIEFDPYSGIYVYDWAYETVPDLGIIVGSTESLVPEPSTAALGGLALLACGAAGVRRWRSGRLAISTHNNSN